MSKFLQSDIVNEKDINEICPVRLVQSLIGGKWKIVILFFLSQSTKRFNELQKVLPSISQSILTHQLRELEKDGLIHREVFKEVPPKVEYSLTEVGQSFTVVLNAMKMWSEIYKEYTLKIEK